MALFATKLEVSDRETNDLIPQFVPLDKLKRGMERASQDVGVSVTVAIEDVRAEDVQRQAVVVTSNVPGASQIKVFVVQSNMGVNHFLRTYYKGMRVAQENYQQMIFDHGGLVGGIIGNAAEKRKQAKLARAEDYKDMIIHQMLPLAIDYAQNDAGGDGGYVDTGNGGGNGGGYAGGGGNGGGYAGGGTNDDERRRKAEEERRRREQEEAKRKAAEAQRQQQAAEAQRKAEEERRRREQEEAQRKAAEAQRQQQAAEAQRKAAEAEARRKAEEERKRRERDALTAPENTLAKLVYLTREEARTGCTKTLTLSDGRTVTATIPAGVGVDSHVDLAGQGRMDKAAGVRGILRLSFAFSD